MNTKIDELWGKALDRAVPDTYSMLSLEQVELIGAVFAELLIKECANHILTSSDRHRKEHFADKVLELLE